MDLEYIVRRIEHVYTQAHTLQLILDCKLVLNLKDRFELGSFKDEGGEFHSKAPEKAKLKGW